MRFFFSFPLYLSSFLSFFLFVFFFFYKNEGRKTRNPPGISTDLTGRKKKKKEAANNKINRLVKKAARRKIFPTNEWTLNVLLVRHRTSRWRTNDEHDSWIRVYFIINDPSNNLLERVGFFFPSPSLPLLFTFSFFHEKAFVVSRLLKKGKKQKKWKHTSLSVLFLFFPSLFLLS